MDSRSPIAFHILDSSIGKPASGIHVHLLVHSFPDPAPAQAQGGPWLKISSSVTNEQGRCLSFPFPTSGGVPTEPTLRPGAAYQVVFETKEYFERTGGRKSFYPFVQITFTVEDPTEHYHVPVLISPFSYTTYRGS